MSIHDCYATLAPDVRDFAKTRRWELALLYTRPVKARPYELCKQEEVSEMIPGIRSPLGLPTCAMGSLEPLASGFNEYQDR